LTARRPVVVLVKPPERSRFSFGAFSLAVLAAAVRDLADVRILDATRLTCAVAASQIAACAPQWVGITTMALSSLPPACELIREVRRKLPQARIVAGGHGASMLAREPLAAGADAVVRGEGETAFRRLLEQDMALDLPGIVRLKDGVLSRTDPAPRVRRLDRLPVPARDLMPDPQDGVHLMETSRGCPHACRFCETTRFYGRTWRAFSPQRVAAEVRRLVRKFGAWIIEITDDNFAAGHGRVLEICRLLEKHALPAFFMVSARADDLANDPGLLPAMAQARMLRISVGVETLSPTLARSAGKFIALETYRELFRRMRALGIFSVASFIVGLPGETPRERAETLDKALAAAPDAAQFIPFYPFPGVPMADGRQGLEPSPDAVRDAQRFTSAFYRQADVHDRLLKISAAEDIRGRLARGTLAKYAGRIQCGRPLRFNGIARD
jgi:radical SAM superfamily enzyme YgiQ (UPF0313 family)